MKEFYNLLIKIIFFVSLILQVILWPSVYTLTFTAAVALEGIVSYFMMSKKQLAEAITGRGVLLLHGTKKSLGQYLLNVFITTYMAYFFIRYLSLQYSDLPRLTHWIHPDRLKNYSFVDNINKIEDQFGLTDDKSHKMRRNYFTWPREHEDNAVLLTGYLPEAQPTLSGNSIITNTLQCYSKDVSGFGYSCFAANIANFEVPEDDLYKDGKKYRHVPMSSQFYTIDVKLTPETNRKCEEIEVYRIVVNGANEVVYSLDYPASGLPPSTSTGSNHQACGLFNTSSWCLRYLHSFDKDQYKQRIKEKCVEGGGSLIFRLPSRSIDIDPLTGKTNLDALIVSRYTDVRLKFKWHYEKEVVPPLIRTLEEWGNVDGDMAQSWRDSSEDASVFFKFMIAIVPFLICWYVLARDFPGVVSNTNQVIFLCIFVLLPSSLLFLTVGAYLPMVGTIFCAIAINHPPPVHSHSYPLIGKHFRPIIFFITAVCNSIQFIWILVLISQAGWQAFWYDYSIKQLTDISSQFILSSYATPMWVTVITPTILTINITLVLGWAMGFVLEVLPGLRQNQ